MKYTLFLRGRSRGQRRSRVRRPLGLRTGGAKRRLLVVLLLIVVVVTLLPTIVAKTPLADMVIARYVLEHVADPDGFMASVARVLRPGGAFVFLTLNRDSPVMWVPRILSHRLHVRILAATRSADAGDVFPTLYRANSLRALAALARRHGLVVSALRAGAVSRRSCALRGRGEDGARRRARAVGGQESRGTVGVAQGALASRARRTKRPA